MIPSPFFLGLCHCAEILDPYIFPFFCWWQAAISQICRGQIGKKTSAFDFNRKYIPISAIFLHVALVINALQILYDYYLHKYTTKPNKSNKSSNKTTERILYNLTKLKKFTLFFLSFFLSFMDIRILFFPFFIWYTWTIGRSVLIYTLIRKYLSFIYVIERKE